MSLELTIEEMFVLTQASFSQGLFTWRKIALLLGPALLIGCPLSIVFCRSVYMQGRGTLVLGPPHQLARAGSSTRVSFLFV